MSLPSWQRLRYPGAVTVRSRAELDDALAGRPRFIAVEGTDFLRAYAASLAHRGGPEDARIQAAALLEAADGYRPAPTLGRITDGTRHRGLRDRRHRAGTRMDRIGIRTGIGAVAACCLGLLAALAGEWLLWPGDSPDLVRRSSKTIGVSLPAQGGAAPTLVVAVLVVLATGAMAFLAWQAIGPGRAVRIGWRIAARVPGRLVLARVRRRR